MVRVGGGNASVRKRRKVDLSAVPPTTLQAASIQQSRELGPAWSFWNRFVLHSQSHRQVLSFIDPLPQLDGSSRGAIVSSSQIFKFVRTNEMLIRKSLFHQTENIDNRKSNPAPMKCPKSGINCVHQYVLDRLRCSLKKFEKV